MKRDAEKDNAAKLVFEGRAVDATIVRNAITALSEDRLKILKLIADAGKYPAEIAKELKMQVQTVYYHIRLLLNSGLIEFEEYEEKKGGIAKKYRSKAEAVAFLIKENWKPFSSAISKKPPFFFAPFISSGFFDGKFILGSPEPHGEFRSRASELCSAEIAMMLGNYATFSYPLYYLDTETDEKILKENLIVVGGPKVNTVTAKINSHLSICFEKDFSLYSKLSKRKYSENFGVIELIENPFAKRKSILVVGGADHNGTRVAVLALLKEKEKIENGNVFDNGKIAKVLQGFDEDGDGIVDAVEILE